MYSNLKTTAYIIPAATNRKVKGKSGQNLKLALNLYEKVDNDDKITRGNEKCLSLIFVHANGFHKELWEPIINSLIEKFDGYKVFCWALDCSNHGDS